jgi:hypothetical protein
MSNLLFYPQFTRADQEEFTDQFYRVMFYVWPVIDRIGEIVFVVEDGMVPGEMPDYFDTILKTAPNAFDGVIRFVQVADLEHHIPEATHIMHWRIAQEVPEWGESKSIEPIDRVANLEECQEWLRLSSKIGKSYSYRLRESRALFNDVISRSKAKKAYIFGTGPSLSLAGEHDYSDGVCIVCNSMVKNHKLLDRMSPPLIVAGDPIFHGGCSIYAGDFRTTLWETMERYDAVFMCNQRDFRIFEFYAPGHLKEKIIGAPAEYGLNMKTDMSEVFEFAACPNILTLYLLPLATMLSSEEILIAGCDGRPLSDNKYFWKHDTSVQFNNRMGQIQDAHPSFFDISYDDYYFLHCKTVESWIRSAEGQGRKVTNMTPSYIPALKKRLNKPNDVLPGTPATEVIMPWTHIRMAIVFARRQLTVIKAIKPTSLKQRIAGIFGFEAKA